MNATLITLFIALLSLSVWSYFIRNKPEDREDKDFNDTMNSLKNYDDDDTNE